MNNINDIKRIIAKHRKNIEQKYNVDKISVFGSYVHEKQNKNSDVDILVEFNKEAQIGFFEFLDLENYLKDIIGCEVDLVTKSALKPRIGKHILQELIQI